MANNDTDVPRCRVCGAYMEKSREGETTVVYSCCGLTRCRPKPEYQTDPDLHQRGY